MASSDSYNVFKRTWWRKATPADGPRPDNLVPHMGRKTYLQRGVTLTEARQICSDYNRTHEHGRYSLKAEFESV